MITLGKTCDTLKYYDVIAIINQSSHNSNTSRPLITEFTNQQKPPFFYNLFNHSLKSREDPATPNTRDCWTWHPHESGMYSVAAGYDWLRTREEEDLNTEEWH